MRTGPLLLICLAAGLALSLVFAAVGARTRNLLRLPVTPSLKLPVDLVIGGWVVACSTLACGMIGAFRPVVLLAVILVGAALGKWRRAGWRFRPWLVISSPALLLLPVALAPPFFYDALVYHLGLPWQALQERAISAHPENLFSSFPPLAQMLFAAPVALGLDRVPALLHLVVFASAAVAVAVLARRLGAPGWMSEIAGMTLWTLPAIALVPALPAAEGWLLAAVSSSSSVVLWSVVRKAGPRRSAAMTAGLLCGIGCAARLQGIAWSGILLVILIAFSSQKLRDVLTAGAAWFVGSAPWWIKDTILLGSPFAPIGWHREGIDTLWRDGGSPMNLASSPVQFLRAAWSAIDPHLAYAAPLFLAALLAIATARDRRTVAVGLAALAGLMAWAATGNLPRFLAPVFVLVLSLAASAGRTTIGRWAGGLALVSALSLGLVFSWNQMNRWGGFALPFESETSDMRGGIANNPMPAFLAASALPPDARVLFVGEARVYRFPRPFIAPSQHDVSPLLVPIESRSSARDVVAWLRQRSYTHLLVNFSELARLASGYPASPYRTESGRRRFLELLDFLGPPVIRVGDTAIFRL